MEAAANQKEQENFKFKNFLEHYNGHYIDDLVHKINEEIAPRIDCTQCGNCCKSLMIQIDEHEVKSVSEKLHLTTDEFEAVYVEKGSGGQMIINTIPCHFLKANKCTIYTDRFSSCKEFPALHLPGITLRVYTILMHYHRCPIIFNVVEALKLQLEFITRED